MILKERIHGRKINLRTAEPDDAAFIIRLRTDPLLSRYIKSINPDVEKQRQWIVAKQQQENDYHLIIESQAREPYGVIAIYDINYNLGTFDWGRWVIDRNAPAYTAIESCLLIYYFAFVKLKLEQSLFEVRKKNKKVVEFHNKYASIISEDESFYFYSCNSNQFNALLSMYKKYHNIVLLELKPQ